MKGLAVTLRVYIDQIVDNKELIEEVEEGHTYSIVDLPWQTADGKPARLDAKTVVMVYRMLACGITRIEKRTLKESYIRSLVWSRVFGVGFTDGSDLTWEDFQRRVGLRVNASPMTPSQFNRHLTAELRRSAAAQIRSQQAA